MIDNKNIERLTRPIVIINGSGGKGKDAFIDCCGTFYRVQNVSAIDPAKNALQELCGYAWGDEKKSGLEGEKWRKALSDLKKLSIDINDYPFTYISQKIVNFLKSDRDLLFIHIREPEEIEKIVKKFECQTLLIKNKSVPDIISNDSDANVCNYKYDMIISNDGSIEDLKEQARTFCEAILKNQEGVFYTPSY